VAEHFNEERVSLLALPAGAFNATLKLQRRLSHEGQMRYKRFCIARFWVACGCFP